MIIHCVESDIAGGMYGPFTKKPLAETVLKIVQMTQDETAEIASFDTDPWEEHLSAGEKPFKVEIILLAGKVQSVDVTLRWPPLPEEGLVSSREDYQEHFVWAKTTNEAKIRAAKFASQAQAAATTEETGKEREGVLVNE